MALLAERAFAQSTATGDKVIPWSDQPPPVPPTAKALRAMVPWEELDAWITPNGNFFNIVHYDVPTIDEKAWRLNVAGLVVKPMRLTLDELKALPPRDREVTFTLECSGNNGFPFNPSFIGNARWAGASLAEVLRAMMAETSLGRILLKSAPARVVWRDGRYQIHGMAWGPQPISANDDPLIINKKTY
jgi:DMSO/TMAO reductase YedYZ molybdopterin-dependent catalytic subunit